MFAGELSADATLTDASFALTPPRHAWLESLDRQPQPLIEHLASRRSHRLGIYFESLWQFFLTHDPACDLLAHNLPIHHEGRTLGEFDCLYFCHERQQVIHLELAVKFFLGFSEDRVSQETPSTSTSQANQWLGPDAKDRLDLKLAHLLQKQTRLSDTPAAKEALKAMNIEVDAKEVAFRGYLFTPGEQPLAPPAGFNTLQPLSHWFTCSAIVQEYSQSNFAQNIPGDAFILLPKMQWLGAAQIGDNQPIQSRQAMQALVDQHFSQDHYPLMIAALDAFGHEQARFFATRDDWPGRDNASLSEIPLKR